MSNNYSHNIFSTAKFLLANYKQALTIIEETPTQIKVLTSGHSITDTQFARWLDEERIYLQSKVSEPVEDQLKVTYVEFLIKHREIQ